MKTLCFDIGGTYIKHGLIDQQGKLHDHGKFPTPKTNCQSTIPKALIDFIQQLMISESISNIGISSAGQVDSQHGTIIYANDNLPDYSGCKLVKALTTATNINTYVENDAYCAALGEMQMGAAKDANNFLCLTLGTGVGGAFILNRKLYKGAHNCAAAIGYLNTNNSCIDKVVSTRGILEHYHIISGHKLNGVEFFEQVKAKEKYALTVYETFIHNLSDGLLSAIYLLDPEVIILGGAISSQGDFLFNDINHALQAKYLPAHRTIKVIKAKLENTAGLMGAYHITQNRDYSYA
ncbi:MULTISPECIES: ROK family protein [Cysteiniphilum]|uniref:ROK family protein n=1 Tax=Cysteiniphilum TaxID=2056696 RepID=UPI00177C0F61|nr:MULTISPECIES: ROK family protein [Cysteiniphilum]